MTVIFGGDGEIRPLRYRLWHAPDLCNRSPKGCNSATAEPVFSNPDTLKLKGNHTLQHDFLLVGGDGEIRTRGGLLPN